MEGEIKRHHGLLRAYSLSRERVKRKESRSRDTLAIISFCSMAHSSRTLWASWVRVFASLHLKPSTRVTCSAEASTLQICSLRACSMPIEEAKRTPWCWFVKWCLAIQRKVAMMWPFLLQDNSTASKAWDSVVQTWKTRFTCLTVNWSRACQSRTTGILTTTSTTKV